MAWPAISIDKKKDEESNKFTEESEFPNPGWFNLAYLNFST